MADKTKIEWTDSTWSPVTGCSKVSPACDICYAERITERFHGKGSFAQVTLHPERLPTPLRWRRPRRVFVNSMSDLFHEQVSDEFIARVFAVMAAAPDHTFQILTKRHARMRSLLSHGEFQHQVHRQWEHVAYLPSQATSPDWPLSNVWVGVSTENQRWADVRVPALLETPAAVRFLSCEPLLGPVDLTRLTTRDGTVNGLAGDVLDRYHYEPASVDWIIAGGESGPHARPMHPDWARSLRDQATDAGRPFFFKQWGEFSPDNNPFEEPYLHQGRHLWVDPKGGNTRRYGSLNIRTGEERWKLMHRVGKKQAGRMLDGQTWDEMPAAGKVSTS